MGRYRLTGKLAPAPFLKGKLQRLTAPVVDVRGDADARATALDGELRLASPSLRAVGRARSISRRAPTATSPRRRPAAAAGPVQQHDGPNVRLVWTLDGPFGRADYSYRLTSPGIKFDNTGFVDVRAEGAGRAGPWPMRVPLRLQARAITGVGDVAGAILANVRLEGMLTVTPQARARRQPCAAKRQAQGQGVAADRPQDRPLRDRHFGRMTRYFIPGIGIVDVKSDLKSCPATRARRGCWARPRPGCGGSTTASSAT